MNFLLLVHLSDYLLICLAAGLSPNASNRLLNDCLLVPAAQETVSLKHDPFLVTGWAQGIVLRLYCSGDQVRYPLAFSRYPTCSTSG